MAGFNKARTSLEGKRTSTRIGACVLTVRRPGSGSGLARSNPAGQHYPHVEATLRREDGMGSREVWRGVGKSSLDVFVSGLRYAFEDDPEACGFGAASHSRDVQPLAERERVRKVLARSLAALRRK